MERILRRCGHDAGEGQLVRWKRAAVHSRDFPLGVVVRELRKLVAVQAQSGLREWVGEGDPAGAVQEQDAHGAGV